MKFIIMLFALSCMVVSTLCRPESIFPSWNVYGLFRSSAANAKLANEIHSDSPFERWLALVAGDEIPYMRDDMIRRKKLGQSTSSRLLEAYLTPSNWRIDLNNNQMEDNNPYKS